MKKKKLILLGLITAALILIIISVSIIIDNNRTKIVLTGEKNLVLSYNSEYHEIGYDVKNAKDTDAKNKVIIESNVDTTKLGTYQVTYIYRDNKTIYKTFRNVVVVDNKAPLITLNGKVTVDHEVGKAFTDEGYSVTDDYDGDITGKVKISGNIDSNKIGTYTLTYTVTDTSGNTASITRTVNVKDMAGPTIELTPASMHLKIGTSYVEAGYKATDNLDGDITDKVVVTNNVDTSKVGTYYIEYKVTDSSGNETVAKRRINVFNSDGQVKNIYLTFDDGPSSFTNELMSILKNKGVKATFFVSPSSDHQYQQLNDIINNGHELAIHGYHVYKQLYASKDAFFKYFKEVQNRIKATTGKLVVNYRFPGGSNNAWFKRSIFDEIKAEFQKQGIEYYDWNVDSGDASGKYMSANEMSNYVINQVVYSSRKENVILMHDLANKKTTREALPMIIDKFLSLGYEFKVVNDSSFAPQFR